MYVIKKTNNTSHAILILLTDICMHQPKVFPAEDGSLADKNLKKLEPKINLKEMRN